MDYIWDALKSVGSMVSSAFVPAAAPAPILQRKRTRPVGVQYLKATFDKNKPVYQGKNEIFCYGGKGYVSYQKTEHGTHTRHNCKYTNKCTGKLSYDKLPNGDKTNITVSKLHDAACLLETEEQFLLLT